MPSVRGRIGPWVLISLVLPVVVAGGIEFGALAGILSPSVWIDVLALWPVAAFGAIAATLPEPTDLVLPPLEQSDPVSGQEVRAAARSQRAGWIRAEAAHDVARRSSASEIACVVDAQAALPGVFGPRALMISANCE